MSTAGENVTLAMLLERFDGLIETPDDVKKLEQAILSWAVTGKLVEQRCETESTKGLLESIFAEKADLIEAGKIRKKKLIGDVSPEECSFDAPSNWTWGRLGDIANFIDYRGKTPKKTDSGTPLITAKNVKYGYFSATPREYVAPEIYDDWMTRGIPQKGDVMFTTEAPLGNVTLLETDEKVVFAQRLITLQFYAGVSTLFIKYALMSRPIRDAIYSKATGTTAQGIKASKFRLIPIPLPPIQEQKRIVAKVDELFEQTRALAAGLVSAKAARVRLLDALLAGA